MTEIQPGYDNDDCTKDYFDIGMRFHVSLDRLGLSVGLLAISSLLVLEILPEDFKLFCMIFNCIIFKPTSSTLQP